MSARAVRLLFVAIIPAFAAGAALPPSRVSFARIGEAPTAAPAPRASVPALDTAIARMGGADALRRIDRVRFEMMTLWQRMTFDDRPNDLLGSYELHSDLRNYTLGTWRNTRRAIGGPTLREMTDVVGTDIAIRRLPTPNGSVAPFMPLSIAYVDERKELFAFAPERLLLAAHSASDLRALSDTVIGGSPHARVQATIQGFPSTVFLRRSDGLLAMARYHAAQFLDFGLAPWGDMEVEMWFSRWTSYPLADTRGVAYPTQWDIRRVGEMYKRIVILSANLNATAPADSFAVSDSLRSAFLAGSANKPMWDFAMDSARIIDAKFARFGSPGQAQNAVKIGNKWLFLEGPAVPQQQERDVQWLQGSEAGASVGGLLITVPNIGRGGAAWFTGKKLPVYIPPGASQSMSQTFANWKQPRTAGTVIAKPQWLRMGGDSVWVEPIDYPDNPRALFIYVPSMRWIYSGLAATPLNVSLLAARVAERGWKVDRIGSGRSLSDPFPAQTTGR